MIPEGWQGVLAKQDVVPAGQGSRGRGPERSNNNSSILYTIKHPHMPYVVLGDDQHEAGDVWVRGENVAAARGFSTATRDNVQKVMTNAPFRRQSRTIPKPIVNFAPQHVLYF